MIQKVKKHTYIFRIFICALVLTATAWGFTKTNAATNQPTEVLIANIPIADGEYLLNGSTEPTTETPSQTGYVYYKDGVLTLNDAKLCTGDSGELKKAIYANGDLTINVLGNNQIGALASWHTLEVLEGIVCSTDTTYTKFCDIKLIGSGNLTIYDLNQGISGKNIDIEMTGTLKIEEYGDANSLPECCLKANGGNITIKSGVLDLSSVISYCMYGTKINIYGGSVTACSNNYNTASASPAFNVTPTVYMTNYQIQVGKNDQEVTVWNKKTALNTYNFVSIKPLSGTASTESVTKPKVGKSKITKIKAGKKKATLTFKKVKGAKGYRIKYSTSKKFKKAKVVTVKKNKATIRKLKKGKKYYFKVQAYKKVNGKKYYGKWSAKKKSKKIK